MNCKICNRLIISDSISVVTDTLLIDIPTGTYADGAKYCIITAQSIPDTATINMPVAVSIGGDTTTVYPLVRCNGTQVTAAQLSTRFKYPVVVSTTSTGGVFKVLGGLFCVADNSLAALPVTTADTATGG